MSKNKYYGILGLARSGYATIQFCIDKQIKFIAWDDNEQTRQRAQECFSNLSLIEPNNEEWTKIDILIISPGIPTTFPKPHKLIPVLKKHHIPIICDIELFYRYHHQARFIGITGTNGKSTTTSLIGHVLKTNDLTTSIGGNIGTGVFSLPEYDADGTYVIETSSYQLELLDQTHFNIAILLNITPDHLDRHGNMENYIAAKCKIFTHQNKHDLAILSIDNPITNKIHQKLIAQQIIGKIVAISTKIILENGISVIDNNLYVDGIAHNLPEFTYLKGEHNNENIAAAIATALFIGIELPYIIQSISSFHGLDHRLQYIGRSNQIIFYNDSKATNAESTEKALNSFPGNIYWIAGGVAKEGGITLLQPLFHKIKYAFLIGRDSKQLAQTLENKVPYIIAETLENAFNQAVKIAQNDAQQSIILLSPACASLDQWKSFEERGEAFKNLSLEFIANHDRNL